MTDRDNDGDYVNSFNEGYTTAKARIKKTKGTKQDLKLFLSWLEGMRKACLFEVNRKG